MKRSLLIVKALIIFSIPLFAACEFLGTEPHGTLHEVFLFSEDFWGEWIRMDTGETWYFAGNYRKVGNNFYSTAIDMEKQSQNVIKVTEGTGAAKKDYFLYASRVRNSTFDAKAVRYDDTMKAFRRSVNVPKGTEAAVEAAKNGVDRQTAEIDENGEFKAENIIAGDDYIVTIDDYEFTVTPNTDGDNVGVLTLTEGVNIKTTIVPSSSVDMMRLFSGETYDLTITFKNIGKEEISSAMTYHLTLPPDFEIIKNANSPRLTTGDLQSILPGQKRDVGITVKCGSISEEYEFKEIIIDIEDFYGKKWTDSVSLRINKEKITFNIKSNLAINGIVIVPNGRAYHFKTSGSGGSYSASVAVPKYISDYLIVFSGASASTEAKYSFAVNQIPAVNFNDYGITDLNKYWPNGTEEQAAVVDFDEVVKAYLIVNQANYYKVKIK